MSFLAKKSDIPVSTWHAPIGRANDNHPKTPFTACRDDIVAADLPSVATRALIDALSVDGLAEATALSIDDLWRASSHDLQIVAQILFASARRDPEIGRQMLLWTADCVARAATLVCDDVLHDHIADAVTALRQHANGVITMLAVQCLANKASLSFDNENDPGDQLVATAATMIGKPACPTFAAMAFRFQDGRTGQRRPRHNSASETLWQLDRLKSRMSGPQVDIPCRHRPVERQPGVVQIYP